jgi:hypothetical protein
MPHIENMKFCQNHWSLLLSAYLEKHSRGWRQSCSCPGKHAWGSGTRIPPPGKDGDCIELNDWYDSSHWELSVPHRFAQRRVPPKSNPGPTGYCIIGGKTNFAATPI